MRQDNRIEQEKQRAADVAENKKKDEKRDKDKDAKKDAGPQKTHAEQQLTRQGSEAPKEEELGVERAKAAPGGRLGYIICTGEPCDAKSFVLLLPRSYVAEHNQACNQCIQRHQ